MPTSTLQLRNRLEAHGFATVPGAIDEPSRSRLLALLSPERLPDASRHPSGAVFAARHLLVRAPQLAGELNAVGLDALASQFLSRGAFPIDAIYFDKQAAANWTVPAHQDRIMPVRLDRDRKHRVSKGVVVAEPSEATLSRLLALRVSFDEVTAETGALFVLPGSHASGILGPEALRQAPLDAFVPCAAEAGDVLLMRPLLLHRSSPSRGDGHRRVLHVVYAAEQPDDGLRWRRDDGASPNA